jgi:energy-converting hydrogenase B subunit D
VTALQAMVLALVALGGPAVVLCREPLRQAMLAGIYGLVLSVLFLVFQAPDVSLSEIAVGGVILPSMVLVALATLREQREDEQAGDDGA